MNIQDVLRKVTGLRNLAAKAGTVAEAEAAAARADALIHKYRLSEADVESASTEAPKEAPTEGAPLAESMTQIPKWHRRLVCILADHYGCFMWTSGCRGYKWKIRIVGRPSDVEVVRYMFAWISTEIARFAQNEHGKADRNAFCLGACVGIRDALRRSTNTANAEHVQQSATPASAGSVSGSAPILGSSALALVARGEASKKEAERIVGKFVQTSKTKSSGSSDSFLRGRTAGDKMHVGKSLPGASKMLTS